MKLGDLVCLNRDLRFSEPLPKGLLGIIVEERERQGMYHGLPGDWTPTYKEYRVLIMTSGEYRWFAASSLELMDETR